MNLLAMSILQINEQFYWQHAQYSSSEEQISLQSNFYTYEFTVLMYLIKTKRKHLPTH
jgi:hypothetical protein